MKYKLSEVAYYSKEKIKTDDLSPENYLSTENMLPEFGGITTASSLPTISTVTKYQPGDVLLSNIRPYFKKLYYSTSEGGCSNDVLCLCAKDNIIKAFLYYSLKNDDFFKYVMATAKGTKMPRGDKSAIMDYELEVPDLETQQKIVRILSALDQKIELNHKQNQNLSDIIKTFFKNTLNGISDTVKLGEISKVFSGKRPDSLNEMGKYEVVGARNVMGYTNAYNQEAGTIITGRVGTLGIIKRYPRKTWASDNTLVIDTEFKNCIECFLSGIDLNSYNRGSTQPLITQTDLKNLIIPFEKERFLTAEQKMTPLRNKIFNNELENEQLALLRDALLPKLLSGSISLESMQL